MRVLQFPVLIKGAACNARGVILWYLSPGKVMSDYVLGPTVESQDLLPCLLSTQRAESDQGEISSKSLGGLVLRLEGKRYSLKFAQLYTVYSV